MGLKEIHEEGQYGWKQMKEDMRNRYRDDNSVKWSLEQFNKDIQRQKNIDERFLNAMRKGG